MYELPEDECLLADSVDIAVVMGEYDHIEGILSQLDLDYDLFDETEYLNLVLDANQLNEYDIVFFNCGMPFDWMNQLIPFTNNLGFRTKRWLCLCFGLGTSWLKQRGQPTSTF